MMSGITTERLAELDAALAAERALLDRLVFSLAVARLLRDDPNGEEALDRFEQVADTVGRTATPHLDLLADVCGRPLTTTGGLVELAERAPEPYRTMFADHLDGLERIGLELGCDRVVPASRREEDHGHALERVLTTAARGAVSGSAFPRLRAFVTRMPGSPARDA